MRPLVLAMPGNDAFARCVAEHLGAAQAGLDWRRFPDGESYVRLANDVSGAHLIIVCTLADPDPKILSLVYAAQAARDMGAVQVTLVAPYLAYMRQDKAFRQGEAVSSTCFAGLLCRYFDALVTVDPHLHRHKALSDIYTIPAFALHAAPLIASWVSRTVEKPLIIGPDEESEQWVSEIAGLSGAPFTVLHKVRSGDREVHVRLPEMSPWQGRQPVLVDDIVSSGRTMIEAAGRLRTAGFPAPICAVVHAVFAQGAYADLDQVTSGIVSTDSIAHASNGIGLAPLVADGIVQLVRRRG